MPEAKVKIFKKNGELLGYFQEVNLQAYPQGEYEISGQFYLANGELAPYLDFNPQALPCTAELTSLPNSPNKKLRLVYVQHARQPIKFSGVSS
jgi:hypothetical protein